MGRLNEIRELLKELREFRKMDKAFRAGRREQQRRLNPRRIVPRTASHADYLAMRQAADDESVKPKTRKAARKWAQEWERAHFR